MADPANVKVSVDTPSRKSSPSSPKAGASDAKAKDPATAASLMNSTDDDDVPPPPSEPEPKPVLVNATGGSDGTSRSTGSITVTVGNTAPDPAKTAAAMERYKNERKQAAEEERKAKQRKVAKFEMNEAEQHVS
jgi:hypothetical protein